MALTADQLSDFQRDIGIGTERKRPERRNQQRDIRKRHVDQQPADVRCDGVVSLDDLFLVFHPKRPVPFFNIRNFRKRTKFQSGKKRPRNG